MKNNNGSVLIVEGAEKKPRTARKPESITAGALSLTLKERVELRKQLTSSIDAEVKKLKEDADLAAELVK